MPARSTAADAPPPAAGPEALVAALHAANPQFADDGRSQQLIVDPAAGVVRIQRCATPFTDIAPLAKADFCTDLTLHGCGVSDLAPLRGLKLAKLDIGDCQVADLEPLRGMPITDLVLVNCRVRSLEPLRGMKLRSLKTNVDTLSFYEVIGAMDTLESLDFAFCMLDGARIATLKPTITTLFLNHVSDIDHARGNARKPVDLEAYRAQPLANLTIEGTPVADWSALARLRGLTSLSLSDEPFTDTAPLRELPLAALSVSNPQPRPLDLAGIDTATLRQLALNRCLVDLTPLAKSPLTAISFTAACVTGGSEALRSCPSLASIVVNVADAAGNESRKTYTGEHCAEAFLRDVAAGAIKLGTP